MHFVVTSSVSYCSPPQSLIIEHFYVQYFADNSTVYFNVSAASVEPNLDVDANLQLNVYGMYPFNFTINLCNILSGVLCPLPTYNFTGSQYIPLADLSSSDVIQNVESKIPDIAYKIPDLEAFAQLTLTERNTGQLKACIQATLSNGWSARQFAVQWSTGGVTLFYFIMTIFASMFYTSSLLPFRFLDFFSLFQHVVLSALLGLNYPVVYRSFVSNFSWSFGLFFSSPSSNIQLAINNMRRLTGGNMNGLVAAGQAIELIDRKLSPYSIPASQGVQLLNTIIPSLDGLGKRDVATVTDESSSVLQAGIPIFVSSLGISTPNAFSTVFFNTLIFLVIFAGATVVFWSLLKLFVKQRKGPQTHFEEVKDHYLYYVISWAIYISLILFIPLTVLSFYQYTLKDAWLPIFLSVISLLSLYGFLAYSAYKCISLTRRCNTWALYTQSDHLTSFGPLYAQYKESRWWFFFVTLFALLIKFIFIAFAEDSGIAQVIGLLLIEIFFMLPTVLLRPHERNFGRVVNIFLCAVRILNTGLLFAFVETFNVKAIPRVAIGIVLAVVWSIAILVLFFNLIFNIFVMLLKISRGHIDAGRRLSSREEKSEESLAEKGDARPSNPTPDQLIPLDRHVIQLYSSTNFSISITPPSITSISPHEGGASRESDKESGSTTLGSVLPRRNSWIGLGLERLVDDVPNSATTNESFYSRTTGTTSGGSHSRSNSATSNQSDQEQAHHSRRSSEASQDSVNSAISKK